VVASLENSDHNALVRYCLFLSLASASVAANADVLHFKFTSDPGDWVGGGQTRDIVYYSTSDYFHAGLMQWGPTGPDRLDFIVGKLPGYEDSVLAQIGTNKLGQALHVGVYYNAERTTFASDGRPGLDIGFQSRGSNTIAGRFEITDIAYHDIPGGEWQLDRFAMTFEQHSEGATPAMRGSLTFAAVPEPGTLAVLGLSSFALIRRRRK